MDRRGLLRAATLGSMAAFASQTAWASLARALRLEELVGRSRHVLLAEHLDASSAWEQIGQRRHIVTYTRVRALEVLAGEAPQEKELLVRTLGGRMGDLGELVHGEAQLTLGGRGVLFAMPTGAALAVTAMAQGHYPLEHDASGTLRLRRNPEASELLNESGSAIQRLVGLQLHEARAMLRAAVSK